jgi:phospholipase C
MEQQMNPRLLRIGLTLLAILATPWLLRITTDPPTTTAAAQAGSFPSGVQRVWVIVMENTNWSSISGNTVAAPYINSLLTRVDAAYATRYSNPSAVHPSEPNYLWFEAGAAHDLPNGAATVSFTTDADPNSSNSTSTTDHLVTYLNQAGISWKAYQEGIDGTTCPLASDRATSYAAKHNPMIFFQDVTGSNDPASAYCIEHERPLGELATDLEQDAAARYSFITPDLCHDMHTVCAPSKDRIRQGDDWLAANLPTILNSAAYANGGAVFLTWDEAASGDGPIGMIVLSPVSKGNGYHNALEYDHGSLLRTLEELFGVNPLLRGAATAIDLSDLFIPAT